MRWLDSLFLVLRRNRQRTVTVLAAFLGLLACAAPALAEGGKVLPPDATPKGYSLSDMAVETAAYNVSGGTGTLPRVPFEVLRRYRGIYGKARYIPVRARLLRGQLAAGACWIPQGICDQDDDADFLAGLALPIMASRHSSCR